MKPKSAFQLAQGIQLLHLDGNRHYTHTELSKVVGVSTSTIKRNRDIVKLLDVALHLTENDDEVQ
jgi:hypothetical protein